MITQWIRTNMLFRWQQIPDDIPVLLTEVKFASGRIEYQIRVPRRSGLPKNEVMLASVDFIPPRPREPFRSATSSWSAIELGGVSLQMLVFELIVNDKRRIAPDFGALLLRATPLGCQSARLLRMLDVGVRTKMNVIVP